MGEKNSHLEKGTGSQLYLSLSPHEEAVFPDPPEFTLVDRRESLAWAAERKLFDGHYRVALHGEYIRLDYSQAEQWPQSEC